MDKIKSVKSENKRELIISGQELAELIEKNHGKLESNIYKLKQLNLLRLSECVTFCEINETKLNELTDLQSLLLFGNKLSVFPDISKLKNLKILDLSRNKLTTFDHDFTNLQNLSNVNLFDNELTTFQMKSSSVKILNLSKNKLTKFPENLSNSLSELNISKNEITDIPEDLCTSLKILDMSENKVTAVPKSLALIKFKTLNMKQNPLKDKKLFKYIEQNQSLKAILDHIQKTGITSKSSTEKSSDEKPNSESEKVIDKIIITKFDEDFKVEYVSSVKDIRGFILCCVVNKLEFTAASFKDFLQYQTKLHDTTCKKRELATIATHDFDLIKSKHLRYAAKHKDAIKIQPLNRPNKTYSGTEYFETLKNEADAIRKEKKRSQVTGVYKFLQLLEDKNEFAFLETDNFVCISLPPLTNAEDTKISLQTNRILIEVTSSHSAAICNKVMSELIKKLNEMSHESLELQQVKIVNSDGTLKTLYPSKVDLNELETDTIQVIRP